LGARGYLLKNTSIDEIEKAILAVSGGDVYLQKEVEEILKNKQRNTDTDDAFVNAISLTKREKEVLGYILRGFRTEDIAVALSLKKYTVDEYRDNLLRKMNAKNSAELIRIAFETGLLLEKKLLLLLLILGHAAVNAQNALINIKPSDQEVEIISQTSYLLDPTGKLYFSQIQSNQSFQRLPKNTISFGSNQSYLWLKFSVLNNDSSPRIFSLVSKGIDSLRCFQVSNATAQILHSGLTGTHIPFNSREFAGPYLAFTFQLQTQESNTIYVRVRTLNYPLSVSPFKIFSQNAAKTFIKRHDLLQSIYIGSMVFLLLFGSALLFFFQEKLYLY